MTTPDVFAVVLKSTMRVVGMISAGIDTSRRNLAAKTIGCALDEAYWNQGIMTEAVGLMIRHLFDDPGTELIAMDHFVDNWGSRRVIEKNGFHYEGTLRRGTTRFDGQVLDNVCYSLLREEYEALCAKEAARQ